MTIVDLSVPLATGMPVYPGDPEVTIEPELTIDACGVEVHALHIGSHSGTHVDAPSHTVTDGRAVDDVDISRLVGPTLVLDVRREVELPDEVPERVFVCTGWDEHWGAPEMVNHPAQPVELVERLWDRGMRVLGVDCLSPDPTPAEIGRLPVHDLVLGRDGLIVENLRGLVPLVGRTITAAVVPLRLVGVDGSPVRAWATA